MSVESRVEYLLKAAARAEREGNAHLANVLRKMAEELGPAEPGLPLPDFSPSSRLEPPHPPGKTPSGGVSRTPLPGQAPTPSRLSSQP